MMNGLNGLVRKKEKEKKVVTLKLLGDIGSLAAMTQQFYR